jgi:hypothetical protein
MTNVTAIKVQGVEVRIGKQYAVTYRNEKGQCHYCLSRGVVDSFKNGNILFNMVGHGYRSFKPSRIEEIMLIDVNPVR